MEAIIHTCAEDFLSSIGFFVTNAFRDYAVKVP
jgi:hypothetical protein